MLPLEKALAVSDECGAPVVSICGGEPLLYPEIKELVEGLLERKRVVYLCTNGVNLEKKLGLFKPHHLFNINIHLDGLKSTHDAIVEMDGVFDKVISGIKTSLSKGFSVCTNTTIYKQTAANEVKELVNELSVLGVHGILLSPGYSYEDVENREFFLTREDTKRKFKELEKVCRNKRIWSTPLFTEFLRGERELACTPWGNVTYNVKGWKAPCYLITDKHYGTYNEFINFVDWDKYGPGKDKRCEHCMVHCGFEPTVALITSEGIRDALKMARWTFL